MCKEAQAADESQEKMNWESIDPDSIRVKFNQIKAECSSLQDQLARLASDGTNHKTIFAHYETVRDQILSPSGWVSSFYTENAGSFPHAKANAKDTDAKPDWYYTLLPEKRKQYDEVSRYMVDSAILLPLMKSTAAVMAKLPLTDTFRNILIVRNLERTAEIKLDLDTYKKMNEDFAAFNTQIRQSFDELEGLAVRSKQYYASNQGVLDPKDLKEGYLHERKSDYSAVINKRAFYDKLYYQGNGLYSLKTEYATKMGVYDLYSKRLVELKESDLENKLKAVKTDALPLIAELEKSKNLQTNAGSFLQSGLLGLTISVNFFATVSLEHFQKFLKGPMEAPYCLMRKMDAISAAPPDFGYSPKKDDPWNGGTALQEAYKQACVAITLQCRDFVNNKGKIKK